jgi:hypothetical protein
MAAANQRSKSPHSVLASCSKTMAAAANVQWHHISDKNVVGPAAASAWRRARVVLVALDLRLRAAGGSARPLELAPDLRLRATCSDDEVLWRQGPPYGGEPRQKVGATACWPTTVLDVPVPGGSSRVLPAVGCVREQRNNDSRHWAVARRLIFDGSSPKQALLTFTCQSGFGQLAELQKLVFKATYLFVWTFSF